MVFCFRYSIDQIMITGAQLQCSTCSESFRVSGNKDISDAELPTVITSLCSNNRASESLHVFYIRRDKFFILFQVSCISENVFFKEQ